MGVREVRTTGCDSAERSKSIQPNLRIDHKLLWTHLPGIDLVGHRRDQADQAHVVV
jgi:hypothetical protein